MQYEGVKQFKISLLHPSRGRAIKARQAVDYWLSQSSGEHFIEHILSLDSDDPQLNSYQESFKSLIVNDNDCVVKATNHAAKIATGEILIYLSDDFKCPRHWDKLIIQKIGNRTEPTLLKVDDCLQPFTADVLTIPIMNRALYERLGYFFHPGYKSMYVDQDLFWVCTNNGWMINAANLKFPHEHYVKGACQIDETYKRSAAFWDQGKALYRQRKQENFQ